MDSIDHITLAVSDIDQNVAWYQTSFSCELIDSGKNYAVLQFENIKLTLILPSQQNPHIGFVKSDANTYGELFMQPDGHNSTFVSDPTGNLVELIEPNKG